MFNIIVNFCLGTIAATLMTSCSSTQFTEYRSNEIYQGRGGAVRTVGGVEIWSDGLPERKFKVIGQIEDTQRDTMNGNGLLTGMLQQSMQSSSRDSNLASQAKSHGGDAVIILKQGDSLRGYAISGNATLNNYGSYQAGSFSGTASARYNHFTTAFVVKYLEGN
jgi:hypothetical protein